ncbi:hypothetical protein ACSBR2_005475 [Camellia fascicularis]
MEKRIAIIGAGLSSLLGCRYILEKGFQQIVFEAEWSIGGIWGQTIESTRFQNTQEVFQFSDFPWPSYVKEVYPILEYIESYAQHFGILPYIKFNSKVISIDYVGESDVDLQSWDRWGGAGKPYGSKEYQVEFVILCIGGFSGLPNIPDFHPHHGPEVYTGKVMHSMDYAAMDKAKAVELIKGKRVTVIGSQKTAVDIAAECANANGVDYPCTMIQRTTHWMLSTGYIWGVNLGSYTSIASRSYWFTSLRWGISTWVESYLRWKLPSKKLKMILEQSFLQDISCQILMLPENFYDKVEEGSIILKKSQSFGFCN